MSIKRNSVILGLLISFAPVLPVLSAPGQELNTKSFTQWCQNKLSVPVETRKTIDLLLNKAGTDNCQLANLKLRELTKLDLRGNEISDVTPLASLINLKEIGLSKIK